MYAEALQPGADAGGMPAVAIAGNEQLVPLAAARIPLDGAPERQRAFGDQFAVGFRRGGVAQRLIREVAAVADQVTQQRDLGVRPIHRVGDLGKLPGLERKVRVLTDWVIELFFPRDIVQTIDLK